MKPVTNTGDSASTTSVPVPAPRPKRRWKRWAWGIFIVLNVAGVFLAWPLVKAVLPLAAIWWHTHSQANFRTHQQQLVQATPATQAAPTNLVSAHASPPTLDTNASFHALTNQLAVVQHLSEADLSRIVTAQFGHKKRPTGDPRKFDQDSAVFDNIASANIVIGGTNYYCYEVDLVDQNGNHKIYIDAFTEPNLDYERSKATMELVNRTPELRKIYNAMAYVLAEKSADTNEAASASNAEPALRLEADPPPKRP